MTSLSDYTVFNIAKSYPKSSVSERKIYFNKIADDVCALNNIKKQNKTIKRSVCDYFIKKNLESFLLPHLHLILDFIPKNIEEFGFYDFQKSMKSLLLSPIHENPSSIIDCIAESVKTSVEKLIKKENICYENFEEIEAEWNKQNKGIPINIKKLSHISADMKLETINDLCKLHIIAFSLHLKIFLLVSVSKGEDNLSDDSFVFTSVIGDASSPKHTCYIYCQTFDKFYLLQPLFSNKEKEMKNQMCKTIQTLKLPGNEEEDYLSFSKITEAVAEKTKNFTDVIFQQEINKEANNTSLEFTNSGDNLTVKLILPNDSAKTSHISKIFSEFGAQKLNEGKKNISYILKNTKLMEGGENTFAVSCEVKSTNVTADELKEIKTSKDLAKLGVLCDSFNISSDSISSLRLINSISRSPRTFESSLNRDTLYVKTRIPSISLAKAAKNPYCDLLCLEGIFHAGAKSKTICCKYCNKSRRLEENRDLVMYPIRKKNKVFVKWICKKCFEQQSDKRKKEIIEMFPAFHSVISSVPETKEDIVRINALDSAYERVHAAIMNLRSQPIGSLRILIPKIDAAYEELISIIKLFRQRMLQMKKVTASDLISIRNKSEYIARVGKNQRIVLLPEPDEEVIDYKLFSEYVAGLSNETEDTTQYLLTIPAKDIKERLIDEAKEFLKEGRNKGKEISFDTQDYGVNELDYSVVYSGIEESECRQLVENVYNISLVESESFITSPIVKLTTRNVLKAVAINKENRILVVLHDSSSKKVTVHNCPLFDSHPEMFTPILTFNDVEDCEVSISPLNSIAVLNKATKEIKIASFDEESENITLHEIEAVPEVGALFISWMDDQLFVCGKNTFYTVDFDYECSDICCIEESEGSEVEALISLQSDVFAVINGKAYSLLGDIEIENVSSNSCACSLNGNCGVLSITEQKASFSPIKEKEDQITVKVLGEGFQRNIIKEESIFDNENDALMTPERFAYALANIVPSLSSFYYKGNLFPVTCDLKIQSKFPCSSVYTNFVNDYYNDVYTNSSLHCTEESLLAFNKEASIISFVSTKSSHNVAASFVDHIFGTTFGTVSTDGIYVSSRMISKSKQIVILYVKNSNDSDAAVKNIKALSQANIASFVVSKSPRECSEIFKSLPKEDAQKSNAIVIVNDSSDLCEYTVNTIERIINPKTSENKVKIYVETDVRNNDNKPDNKWNRVVEDLEKKPASEIVNESKKYIASVATLTNFGLNSLYCISYE